MASINEQNEKETTKSNRILDSKFELIEAVGRGRNSVVYRARPLHISQAKNHFVALKVLTGNTRNPERNVERLHKEALAMLSTRHENVIRLYDYVVSGDLCYLSMEFAEKGDLRTALEKRDKPFSVPYSFQLLAQLLRGLEAIHHAGIIHRDIKPENLLLNREDKLKLTDFGIACLPTEKPEVGHQKRGVGTFDYLAPECLDESEVTQASDLYSVGITLYQLLTKRLPFAGRTLTEQIEKKLKGESTPLNNFIEASDELQALVDKALAVDCSLRFRSAKEFRQAVEQFLNGEWEIPVVERDDQEKTQQESVFEECDFERAVLDHYSKVESLESTEEEPKEDVLDVADIEAPLDTQPEVESELIGSRYSFNARRVVSRSIFYLGATAAVFALVFFGTKWQNSRGSIANAVSAGRTLQLGDEGPERTRLAMTEDVLQGFHSEVQVGRIYNLLGDEQHVSFAFSPLDGDEQLLFSMSIDGWTPKVISMQSLRDGALTVQGHGLQLEFQLSQERLLPDTKINGRYRESGTGREGYWAIW